MAEIQGELQLADHDIFDEYNDWSLLDYPAQLNESEFKITEDAHIFKIDLNGQHLATSYADQDSYLPFDTHVEGLTEDNLIIELDRQIADPRFSQSERLKWCEQHVNYLVKTRGITIGALLRAKFILARKLKDMIKEMKEKEAQKAYQKNLFEPDAKPAISFDHVFALEKNMYEGVRLYQGSFQFKKHFLENVPYIDGGDNGEEFQCALALEGLQQVKYWLRNVAGHQNSFRLPLAQGWTYPDFIAKLEDGRLLIVEYKGVHLIDSPEAREKALIGELWEKQMAGRGLYLMAMKKNNQGKNLPEQLNAKIIRFA